MAATSPASSIQRCPEAVHASHPAVSGCGSANICLVHAQSGLARCNECERWFMLDPQASACGSEEVISALRTVLDPRTAGQITTDAVPGHDARALANVILEKWVDALREGSTDSLLTDFDRAVGELQRLRDCFAVLLHAANAGKAARPRNIAGEAHLEIDACVGALNQPTAPESLVPLHPSAWRYMNIPFGKRKPAGAQ